MKRCTGPCGLEFPLSNFYTRDGHCKPCRRVKVKAYRDDQGETLNEKNRELYKTDPTARLTANKKSRDIHKDVWNKTRLDKRHLDPRPQMLSDAKKRARNKNIPFTITLDDITIPACCPYLGYELRVASGQLQYNSPSLDRIEPNLGYTPDNIQVISHKANAIKQDLSVEDMLGFCAAFFDRHA